MKKPGKVDRMHSGWCRIVPLIMVMIMTLPACMKEKIYTPFCNPSRYFPLDIGNYWVYRHYLVHKDSRVEDQGYDSLRITRDTLMLGYRFYRLDGTFRGKPFSRYLTVMDGQVASPYGYVYFECPSVTGADKIYPIMDFDFPGTIRTVRKDTLIDVPAGTFDPVMLFEAHSLLEDSIWIVTYRSYYAKNVGMVRFSSHQHPEYDQEGFLDLVRYQVKD